MAFTPNSQAIGIQNSMFGNVQKMWDLYVAIKADNKQWNDTPGTLAKTLEGFSTTAVGIDGQLGTADTTPSTDPTHVMDTRVYSTLSRGLAQADVVSLDTFFITFIALVEGAPVTQQGQAPALFAKIIGS